MGGSWIWPSGETGRYAPTRMFVPPPHVGHDSRAYRGVTDEIERSVNGVGIFERGSMAEAGNCPLSFICHPRYSTSISALGFNL